MDRFTEGQRAPDWSSAWVPDGKLQYYLGRVDHRKSADRAAVFAGILGFLEPETLRAALLAHVRTHDVNVHKITEHGVTYNAVGVLRGPSGVHFDRMVTGWIVPPGADVPRNVSAFPDRKRTR